MSEPKYGKLFREAVDEATRDDLRLNPTRMIAGYWQIRLKKGSPWVPAKTWVCDHEPSEPNNKLDQPFLAAEIGGDTADPLDVFAAPERRPIEPLEKLTVEQTYLYLTEDLRHARLYRPNDPLAHPKRRADLRRMEPLF